MDPNRCPELKQGPLFLRDAYNQLRQLVLGRWLVANEFFEVVDTPGGIEVLPRNSTRSSGVAGTVEAWPFQGYRSSFAGAGSPPANQKLRVRIRLGTVNNRVPSNLSQEFVCTAGSDTYFYVECTIGVGGEVSAVQISQGSTIPSDPAGSPDNPPAKTYCGLFRVTCSATAVTSILPLRKASLNVTPVVTAVDCDSNTLALQWT